MAKKPTLIRKDLKKASLEELMQLFNKVPDDDLKPFFSKSMIRRMEKSGFKVIKK
jgi:hypothetical protein|tara:strand:- start:131 stop:295 length:165 start_codon:yes stop_codon:yes gene_type:complete